MFLLLKFQNIHDHYLRLVLVAAKLYALLLNALFNSSMQSARVGFMIISNRMSE